MKNRNQNTVRKFSKNQWWYIASGLATILNETWAWLLIAKSHEQEALAKTIAEYQHEIAETLSTACSMRVECLRLTGEKEFTPNPDLEEPISSAWAKYWKYYNS